jgi:hypothetical protein
MSAHAHYKSSCKGISTPLTAVKVYFFEGVALQELQMTVFYSYGEFERYDTQGFRGLVTKDVLQYWLGILTAAEIQDGPQGRVLGDLVPSLDSKTTKVSSTSCIELG